jgi:primary-amine oxidase
VPAAPHPLDPLTAAELAAAVAAVRRRMGERTPALRLISIDLREPDKAAVAAWRGGGARPPREAFAVLLDRADGCAYEAVVSIAGGEVASLVPLPAGGQPAVSLDEFVEAPAAVRADPRYRAALARRGIGEDRLELVHIEPWTVGRFEPPERRLARCLSWLREDVDDVNPYSRPIGRLVAVVDLNSMEVVRVDDGEPLPLPAEHWDYRAGGGRPLRADVRPLEVRQRDGPSFTLDGRLLRWQRWELRVGFSTREGLVLHEIGYRDGGRLRPICHRASLAELVVPYGDPNPTVHFKNVFDTGEYGLGTFLNELAHGCDCLGEIRYLDVVHADTRGELVTLRNAICIHEEDAGLLWKHTAVGGATDRARSRRLVVSCIATVGNYEYGTFWYLYQDGSLELEAKLTGIVHTAGAPAGRPGPHAVEVAQGVAAGVHQHFFTARLDMDVDGERNDVVETEAAPAPPGDANPEGTAFVTVRRPLGRESAARRDVSPMTARRWRVENRRSRNRMGEPAAYELVPGENVAPMAAPDSPFRRRARYLDHQLWVTPYRPDERYPAGEYPNQHGGGDGLPRWTAADRPLADGDVVLWYTFGSHHVPRLEDWPVMPVVRCGFVLRPVGFFDVNPALDVPPPASGSFERG